MANGDVHGAVAGLAVAAHRARNLRGPEGRNVDAGRRAATMRDVAVEEDAAGLTTESVAHLNEALGWVRGTVHAAAVFDAMGRVGMRPTDVISLAPEHALDLGAVSVGMLVRAWRNPTISASARKDIVDVALASLEDTGNSAPAARRTVRALETLLPRECDYMLGPPPEDAFPAITRGIFGSERRRGILALYFEAPRIPELAMRVWVRTMRRAEHVSSLVALADQLVGAG